MVRRLWGEADSISPADKSTFKSQLIPALGVAEALVQRQLCAALSHISQLEFPAQWPSLLTDLTAQLTSPDVPSLLRTVQVMDSVVEPFRVMEDDDAARTAVLESSSTVVLPLTRLVSASHAQVDAAVRGGAAKDAVAPYFNLLRHATSVFLSLIQFDVPQVILDNRAPWLDMFHALLSLTAPAVHAPDGEEGPLEALQAVILDTIALLADKYDEDIETHLPGYVDDVWKLLTNYSLTRISSPALDPLVTQACKFLSSAIGKGVNMPMFNKPEVLQSIVERIVVPNILLRDTDEELFEDNAVDFIRKDIEGSDADTRRRVATDLVRSMMRNFEPQTTSYCVRMAAQLLQRYAENPSANYASKDAAIALVIAVAVRASTAAGGVTNVNEGINIGEILVGHILPELQTERINDMPIVKAACIKFVSIFRAQLPREHLLVLLPMVARFTGATSFVVHTYAAAAVERALLLKDKSVTPEGKVAFSPRLPLESIESLIGPLLGALFEHLNRPGYPENEYLMKCVLRLVVVARDRVAPLATPIIGALTGILTRVCGNPTNPSFNHYLFEILAAAMRAVCSANPSLTSAFEGLLFPPFEQVLRAEVPEFMPYVFQLLAELLELTPAPAPGAHALSDKYTALAPLILAGALWTKKANVPALTPLLQAYLRRGYVHFVSASLIVPALGVFQSLIQKGDEEHAYAVITAFFEAAPLDAMMPYASEIFRLILTRLSSSRARNTAKATTQVLCMFAGFHGGAAIETIFASFGATTLTSIAGNVMPQALAATTSPARVHDVAVGCTRLLCESGALMRDAAWPNLLAALVSCMQQPAVGRATAAIGDADDDTDAHERVEKAVSDEYSASFAALVYATNANQRTFASVPNALAYLVQSLGRVVATNPQLAPIIAATAAAPVLTAAAAEAGVRLM